MERKRYFNINLEFDKQKVDQIIENTITSGKKGYVCSVEGNILAQANKNKEYLEIINNSLVNICDGSSIAFLASLIYHKKFSTYIGADLFIKYIKEKKYKYYFLGNTEEVLNGLKLNLQQYNALIKEMYFKTLPFKDVDDFDYKSIAMDINTNNPDIIWVSLGAPKQEKFMAKLLPHINKGVMFGFGAIFNFYSGIKALKRAPKWMLFLKLEWLYRIIKEPKRIGSRAWQYIKLIPMLFFNENKKRKQKTTTKYY
ncbi:MAG TPA: WecB/TagA/CpsF family glycosyltransferase [Bacteroidales bacterium]|nr:WecB/TagA/CpsF family glycosyltransferase [Bacteroidales bacterium]